MVSSDWDIFGPIHSKGFRPLHKAMRDEAYLEVSLGTGFRYDWVDRHGNSVAFSHPSWGEYLEKERKEKEKEINVKKPKKGFRGYSEETKFYKKFHKEVTNGK